MSPKTYENVLSDRECREAFQLPGRGDAEGFAAVRDTTCAAIFAKMRSYALAARPALSVREIEALIAHLSAEPAKVAALEAALAAASVKVEAEPKPRCATCGGTGAYIHEKLGVLDCGDCSDDETFKHEPTPASVTIDWDRVQSALFDERALEEIVSTIVHSPLDDDDHYDVRNHVLLRAAIAAAIQAARSEAK